MAKKRRKKLTPEELDEKAQISIFACPVCEARKQKQREAQKRYRAKKEKKCSVKKRTKNK